MNTEPKNLTWLRSITRPAGGSLRRGARTISAACWIRFSGMLSTSGAGIMTAMSPWRSIRIINATEYVALITARENLIR